MKNFHKNEQTIRKCEPEGPEDRQEHPKDCKCINCPQRCLECGRELTSNDIDICEICNERARFFDLGL